MQRSDGPLGAWAIDELANAGRENLDVAHAGGVLRLSDVVYGFPQDEAAQRLEAWCARYDDAPSGGWTRADVEEHIRDEHATFTWLLDPMLEHAGFDIEAADRSADRLFAAYVARAV